MIVLGLNYYFHDSSAPQMRTVYKARIDQRLF